MYKFLQNLIKMCKNYKKKQFYYKNIFYIYKRYIGDIIMTMAIMQLRLQTLNRRIHKNNCKLSYLQQMSDELSLNYTNTSRLYKNYYLLTNGIDATISDEMRQSFSAQLNSLEPVLLMMDEKSNDIELEISAINSELAQETNEFKNVQKWIEDNAKKETAHYTMS